MDVFKKRTNFLFFLMDHVNGIRLSYLAKNKAEYNNKNEIEFISNCLKFILDKLKNISSYEVYKKILFSNLVILVNVPKLSEKTQTTTVALDKLKID